MKKIISLILFVLLIHTALAIEDLTVRESLTLELSINSEIEVIEESNSARLESAEILLNYNLQDNQNQKIISTETNPDAEITDKFLFKYANPTSYPLSYEVRSTMQMNGNPVKVTGKVSYPLTNYPVSVYEYTKPTAMIDINEDIRTLAAELAAGEDDEYVIVYKLASWAKQNVEYDLSSVAADAVEKSSWVLDNRRGVCDEITNLFISMCRSLGIPSRFVTGVSFTNDPQFTKPWGLHGWAEVYFPGYGWVPFDPTYGEIGYVDAGHIKLRDSFDSNKSSTEFRWRGIDVDLNPKPINFDVEVLNKGNLISQNTDLGVSLFDDNVGFGSYNYVKAEVSNNENYYLALDLTLSMPEEITIFDSRNTQVLLKPYETRSVYWKIKVPSDLRKDYRYTFPTAVTTQQNYTAKTSLFSERSNNIISESMIDEILSQVSSDKSSTEFNFFCTTSSNEAAVGEKFVITCTITNNKASSLSNVNVCIEKECKKTTVSSQSQSSVSFEKTFNKTGYQLVTATASGDFGSKAFLTLMVLDEPQVSITELTYPSTVDFNDSFKVSFKMNKDSYATPKDSKVIIYHNKNKEEWVVGDIEGIQPFSVEFAGNYLKFNNNSFKAIVEYHDERGNTFHTEEDFIITLNKTTFWENIELILNQAALWIQRILN